MTPRLLVAMSELRTAIRRPDADLDTALQRFAEAILAHPPADAECGQRAARDAAPAAAEPAFVDKEDGSGGAEQRLPEECEPPAAPPKEAT